MIDQDKKADSSELEKSKAHIIVEIIEYMTKFCSDQNDHQKVYRQYKRNVF